MAIWGMKLNKIFLYINHIIIEVNYILDETFFVDVLSKCFGFDLFFHGIDFMHSLHKLVIDNLSETSFAMVDRKFLG